MIDGESNQKLIHVIGSRIPMMLIFAIIIYIYTIYISTFLYPLLMNTYTIDSQESSQNQEGKFNRFANQIQQIFTINELQNQKKGIIYFIIIHVLLVLLLISIFRSIFTDPGQVPQNWINKVNKEFADYFEEERQLADKLIYDQKCIYFIIFFVLSSILSKLICSSTKEIRPSQQRIRDQGVNIQIIRESIQRIDQSRPFHIAEIMGSKDESEVSLSHEDKYNQKNFENDQDIDDLLKQQLNVKIKQDLIDSKARRFCKYCYQFKPPRCHHCSSCKKCWLKMDHHCLWVNNCIALNNYKYFFNMLIYGSLSLSFILITYLQCTQNYINSPQQSDFMIFTVIQMELFTFSLWLIVLAMTLMHIKLICQNKTTLEMMENKKGARYDLGFCNNIQASLGNNPLTWCIPGYPNSSDDGVSYQQTL